MLMLAEVNSRFGTQCVPNLANSSADACQVAISKQAFANPLGPYSSVAFCDIVLHHCSQLSLDEADAVESAVSRQTEAFKQEYGLFEPNLAVRVSQPGSSNGAEVALTADNGATLLAVLSALPHGVIKTSHAVDG